VASEPEATVIPLHASPIRTAVERRARRRANDIRVVRELDPRRRVAAEKADEEPDEPPDEVAWRVAAVAKVRGVKCLGLSGVWRTYCGWVAR